MGILDDLTPKPQVYTCKIRTLAESLDETDRKSLMDAIANEAWRPEALAKELTRRGLQVTKFPIIKHRENACSCSKI